MNWYKKAQIEDKWYFANLGQGGGFIHLPVVYLRFGDLPLDAKTKSITFSTDGFSGRKEKGVSVYPAYYHAKSGKYILASGGEQYLATQGEILSRPIYMVSGRQSNETGADGEPLLDPTTIKVIKMVSPNDIVTEDDTYMTISGQEIEDQDKIPTLPKE